MTHEDWQWAVAMTLCALFMGGVGYVVGYRSGLYAAERAQPVRASDFAATPQPLDCTRDGRPVRCDKGLEP